VLLLAVVGWVLFVPPVAAQKAPIPLNLAVIDIEAIRRNALVVKDVRDQVAKYRNAFQTDIKKEEEALRTANQELARQRTILSPDAFAQKRRQFEKRLADVQRLVQKRKRDLSTVRTEAMRKVQRVLAKIVTTLAKERKINLVVNRDAVVYRTDDLDFTKVVLERLDKKMPKLKVSKPGK